MKTISKFGFVALAVGAFSGVSLGGPGPGAYFTPRESQKLPAVEVNKSEQSGREKKQTTPNRKKKPASAAHFIKKKLSR